MANMVFDYLGGGGAAPSYSSGDAAWNAYMSSPISQQTSQQVMAPGSGSLWANMPSQSQYGATGSRVPSRNVFSTGGRVSYSGGGGSFNQSTSQQSQATPVEFFLGSAPTVQGVDLSGVMGDFRNTFSQLNSGVNPSFFVDQNKLAADAKSIAGQLNLSDKQIQAMISGINGAPAVTSISDIVSQAASAAATLNKQDPNMMDRIVGQASNMAAQLNAKYQAQFAAAMPGYQQNMAKANKLTTDYLAGKIPQDVVDQVFRNSAAKGFATGLYGGGIGRNIVARDLGLTSLQLQSAGAGLLEQTAKLAATVGRETMPVTGAEFVSPLISNQAQFITNPASILSAITSTANANTAILNRNNVDPNTIFNAVYVKPQDVYNNMANMAQQSTLARSNFEASKLISPSQVFSALTDQAQYNSQIANANALNAWQSQALPGQFDIKKGQFVSFKPGEYLAQRPTVPGSVSAAIAASSPSSSSDFMINMGGVNIPASRLKGPGGQILVSQIRQQQQQAQQQAQQEAQNWTGSAYVPQLRA
jgi:hypothetical protein